MEKKKNFWYEHKGFAVLVTFILTSIMWYMIIIILNEPCSYYNCYSPQTSDNPEAESNKVVFEFDDRYFQVFDNELNILDSNNMDIELPAGYIVSIQYILNNSENFTTLCVEYALGDVDSDLDKVRPPEELVLISPRYDVDCYDLKYPDKLWDSLILEQRYSDVEDSIVKLTLWKE